MALSFELSQLVRDLNKIVDGTRVVLIEKDDAGTTRFMVVDRRR